MTRRRSSLWLILSSAACAVTVDAAAAQRHDNDDPINGKVARLKAELPSLSLREVRERYGRMDPIMRRPEMSQDKIEHFVVLYMENHTPDHFFGCMDLPGHGEGGFDGIRNHSIPADPAKGGGGGGGGRINIECGTSDFVCDGGPGYDTYAGKFGKDGASPHLYPYSPQSDLNSALHGATAGGVAVRMFGPEQLPVKKAIAENFGVFNRFFTSVPSASSPNHLMAQSGTSCGMTSNVLYKACGGPTNTFPQMTIYDSLRLHNVSFGLYLNSTCGLPGRPKCTGRRDGTAPVNVPDVAMAGVARHVDRFYSQRVFYDRAANGTLPSFSWLLPPSQACDHPCHDNAKGERLTKDIYEALRAGPGWNKTLFLVVYDDAGGYYDHVVPPHEGVPWDASPCWTTEPGGQPDTCGRPFDFRRLGLRSAAMLMSPWVPRGAVFQTPRRGPTETSQFDETSILATAKNLFNLSTFLTERDAWAGSLDELLLLDEPRTDCPMHLPDAPPPADPWTPPSDASDGSHVADDGHSGKSFVEVQAVDGGGQHCSSPHGEPERKCAGAAVPSRRQVKTARVLAAYLGKDGLPDDYFDRMDRAEADRWIGEHWQAWLDEGAPAN